MQVRALFKNALPLCLALLSLFAFGLHSAQAADSTVMLKGLRGGTPVSQDIPHNTGGYQITKNFNKCMDCHAWQKTKASGATKVSVTHFRTREGQELDNISPRRYFCTQCHVAQTDAKPLVENTFERARGLR